MNNEIEEEEEVDETFKELFNELIYNGLDQESKTEQSLSAFPELSQLYAAFFNNEKFSDLILTVNEKLKFHVHKMMLAMWSDVFATMLCGANWTPNADCIHLVETSSALKVFDKFLQFFYSGNICVNEECVVDLLCLADKYNVKTLSRLCVEFMSERLKWPSLKRALDWRSISLQLGLDNLKTNCMRALALNAERFIKSNEWIRQDVAFILEFISMSDLVVANELELYTSVCKWLLANEIEGREERFEDNFKLLIPAVRFAQMSELELFEIENCPLVYDEPRNFQPWLNEFLKQFLFKAFRFRCLEEVIVKLNSSEARFLKEEKIAESELLNTGHRWERFDKWYLPRNYTETCLADSVSLHEMSRFNHVASLSRGIAPKLEKDATWRLFYWRLSEDKAELAVNVTCDKNALIGDSVLAQVYVVVYDEKNLVIQTETKPAFNFVPKEAVFNLNNLDLSKYFLLNIKLKNPNQSKKILVLIKQHLF